MKSVMINVKQALMVELITSSNLCTVMMALPNLCHCLTKSNTSSPVVTNGRSIAKNANPSSPTIQLFFTAN
ncbi:hypothetical protein T12_14888 [Trichinella patagoniensis]|uniref:Uncharacterized protein n=1 Tax=Trichinella patagoniensis TaxID=990121 RepID=A0A0V0ZVA2_9BILA|nr:hypothetical protein T12_14888 [Trichinella patagoniensis]